MIFTHQPLFLTYHVEDILCYLYVINYLEVPPIVIKNIKV